MQRQFAVGTGRLGVIHVTFNDPPLNVYLVWVTNLLADIDANQRFAARWKKMWTPATSQ
jgi:hypothetical protein